MIIILHTVNMGLTPFTKDGPSGFAIEMEMKIAEADHYRRLDQCKVPLRQEGENLIKGQF